MDASVRPVQAALCRLRPARRSIGMLKVLVFLALSILVAAPSTNNAWSLRVNPEFQEEFIGEKRPLVFIYNSMPTGLLLNQLSANLLVFSEKFTYVTMDWKVEPGEFVRYKMNISSADTTVMAQPIADAPLVGNLTNQNYKPFTTTLPCLDVDGQTALSVNLDYIVYRFNNETMEYDVVLPNGTALLRIRKTCEKGFPLKLIVGASIGGVILIMILVLIVVVCRYKRKVKRHRLRADSVNEHYDAEGGRSQMSNYTRTPASGMTPLEKEEVSRVMHKLRGDWAETLDGFLLQRDIIEVGKEIGRGAFGRVLTGNITAGGVNRQVAIKTLKSVTATSDLGDFLEEAVVMKEFDHMNVVALMGVCMEGDEPPLVCLEMMHNGDLRSYLRRSRGLEPQNGPVADISVPQLLEFCAMILDGMAYLAAQDFVHRDLATRNCMLNKDLIVKIGDFGLARDIHGEDYYIMGTPRRLPVKWMAFESLQDQVFNSMTDVWSFGVVMWEIFALGRSPYPGVDNSEMMQHLTAGKRMAMPPGCPDDFYSLMLACWTVNKKERPTFKMLVAMLADYRDIFYENVEVKDQQAMSFSTMKIRARGGSVGHAGGRHMSVMSSTASMTTVQTELPYADTSMPYGSSGYSSGGSSGYYVKANKPSDDFIKRLSHQEENPNYSAIGMQAESFNPNYHATDVRGARRPPNGHVAYPLVENSSTPANASSSSSSSPPRGSLQLPSPVHEEEASELSPTHSHAGGGVGNSSQRRMSTRSQLQQELNEERRNKAVEVEL